MSGSNITGALPLSWGMSGALPALVELDLSHNSINGTLPDSWSASNSLPQLRSLALTDNLLGGALPSSWGSQSQSFPSLEVLDVALNSLNGSLPAAWCGAGFPVSLLLDHLPNGFMLSIKCNTSSRAHPLHTFPMILPGTPLMFFGMPKSLFVSQPCKCKQVHQLC